MLVHLNVYSLLHYWYVFWDIINSVNTKGDTVKKKKKSQFSKEFRYFTNLNHIGKILSVYCLTFKN